MIRKRVLSLSIAVLVTVAAVGGWLVANHESGPPDPARERRVPFQDDYVPPVGVATLRVLAFGDSGTGGTGQLEIAHAIAERTKRGKSDFLLVLGDNFYPDGIASATDPRWDTCVKEPYEGLGVPLYAVLGNHDHEGIVAAQVERSSIDPLWKMPAFFYSFEQQLADGTRVQFFALDTTPIASGKTGVVEQTLWLQDQLSKSTADWKIVFGHHPMFSHTNSGDSKLCAELLPLLARYGVALFISGHSHALEILRPRDGVMQIVAGGGGGVDNAHEVAWAEDTEFAATRGGFVILTIMAQRIAIEAVRANARTQFLRIVERP